MRTALSMPNSTGVRLLFDQQGKVIGFHLQIITVQSFTTSFTVMDDFWKKVTDWFDKEMAKAPTGLENGWVGCWNLDFYALQYLGMTFSILWSYTCNYQNFALILPETLTCLLHAKFPSSKMFTILSLVSVLNFAKVEL